MIFRSLRATMRISSSPGKYHAAISA